MQDLTFLFDQKISNCPLILVSNVDDFVLKLSEKERRLIDHIVHKKKKNEFSTGRALLKAGLKKLKFNSEFDLLRKSSGAPLLPKGFLGSISHTNSLVVTCIKTNLNEKGIGIDIEAVSRKVSLKIIDRYLFKDELSSIPFEDENENLVRLFSAKEAYYKAVEGSINFSDIKIFYDSKGYFVDKNFEIYVYQAIFKNQYVISLCINNSKYDQ